MPKTTTNVSKTSNVFFIPFLISIFLTKKESKKKYLKLGKFLIPFNLVYLLILIYFFPKNNFNIGLVLMTDLLLIFLWNFKNISFTIKQDQIFDEQY